MIEDELYQASKGELMDRLRRLAEEIGNVLLIGHNPGLHELAMAIADPNTAGFRALSSGKFPTAARASFRIAEPWSFFGRSRCELAGYVTAELFERPGMKFRRCQYPAGKRNGDRTPVAQRGGIEAGCNRSGVGERPSDAPEQINDQARRYGELTIGEMLDENSAEERVVGGCDRDSRVARRRERRSASAISHNPGA